MRFAKQRARQKEKKIERNREKQRGSRRQPRHWTRKLVQAAIAPLLGNCTEGLRASFLLTVLFDDLLLILCGTLIFLMQSHPRSLARFFRYPCSTPVPNQQAHPQLRSRGWKFGNACISTSHAAVREGDSFPFPFFFSFLSTTET